MKQDAPRQCRISRRAGAGLTLMEVVIAMAIAALASIMIYPAFRLGTSMILANQQKLEAEALAFDTAMEVFNTHDFTGVVFAATLPPIAPPAASLLPSNSEIRVMIVPNTGTAVPYRWDVEVRVVRERPWMGAKTVLLTNETVYRVTRYNTGRN